MATVNKDFKVKNGLIVEGTNATVDGSDIITADLITAGNGEGGNENVTVSYDAETKKVTFAAAPGYTDEDVKAVLTGSTQTNISITEVEGVLSITAENGVEDSTTDDLDEGETNLYYTDQRVKNVLTGSTQTNISITEVEGELLISAENGIADSTTDDLSEGETNLYFTVERVEDVIEDATTDDITEGETNLYYTDERARGSISGGDGIDYDSETGAVSVSYGYGLTVDEESALAVNTDEIATIQYVDALAEGLHIHTSVAVATDEDINLASVTTIDGVTLVEGMRVLVKAQENAAQNGIYVFEDGSLVRAQDHDTSEEVKAGDFVFVEGGPTYGSTGWVQINVVNVLGTDPMEWTQFLGAGTFVGGNGINVDANVISIDFEDFDTDDIDEGEENLYYTNQRVKDVLTGSTQTNISITEVEGELLIAAENGIEDSTTDDLDEGETNLYFTDTRAVDALEAVVPNFTAIEVNSVAKQVAATVSATTTDQVTAYAFLKSEYRSAKFLVKVAYSTHTEVSEVLLTLDSSNNIAITEFAIVSTNGSASSISAEIYNNESVDLVVTPANANSTITVVGTLIV